MQMLIDKVAVGGSLQVSWGAVRFAESERSLVGCTFLRFTIPSHSVPKVGSGLVRRSLAELVMVIDSSIDSLLHDP